MKKSAFVLLALLAPVFGHASHIVGGEFELVHVSGSIYRLNLILYFDLHNGNPGAKDLAADVRIFRKSDNLIMQEVNLPLTDETEVLYTALECTIAELRTSKLVYTALVSLSPDDFNDPQGYYVTWERCCRNYGINNIYSEVPTFPDGSPNPDAKYAGQAFYLEFPAVVKDGEPFIDSTPKLFPPLSDYACVNKPYYVDFAGSDDDGDSLVYSLVTPLNTKTADALPPGGFPRPRPYPEAIWQPGFSLKNVMKGNPDLAISTEGLLTVRPTQEGLFAFAIKCEEFRDGIKIGETRRDFQMLAVTCPSTGYPVITGINPDHPNTIFENVMNVTFQSDAPDDERCIEVDVTDPDAADSDVNIKIRARGIRGSGGEVILPGVTTSTINSTNNKATFKICFDKCPPAYNTPYQILIIASDDACAVPLQDTLRINVTVKTPPNGKTEFKAPVSDVAMVLKQGDSKVSWPIQAVDPDGDSIVFSYLVDGFNLAGAGMKLEVAQPQKGTVNGLFTWDPSCTYNFSTKQNFNVTLLADDKDFCDLNKADKARFSLTVIPPPKPDVSVTQPSCSLATGTITVRVQNEDDVYSFNNGVSFQKANSRSGLAPGTYLIISKNSSGCSSAATKATVNAQPEIPNGEISSIQPTCLLTTGIITVTVKNASDVYSFDGGVTFQAGNTKSGFSPGIYFVVVKNTAGCSSVPVSTTINAPPPKPNIPTLTITQTNPFPICTGVGTITVKVQNASDTYSFDNGATFQASNSKTGLAAGSYQVIINNSAGCKSAEAVANIALLPAPTVTVVQPTCSFGTGTITVTVQNTTDVYSFDNGSNFQSSNVKAGLTPGDYQVVIKDINGCKSVVAPTVVDPPALSPPEITVTHPTCILATGTIVVKVRDATDTYSFNNGATFQVGNSKAGLPSNTYGVVVKNSVGCKSLAIPIIIDPQPPKPSQPVISAVTHPTCTLSTGVITLTIQREGDTFSFDNGANFQTDNARALSPGTYQVVIKNKEGCSSGSTSAVVNAQPPVPSEPKVTISQPLCINTTGAIKVTGQKVGDTFSFDGGSTFQTDNFISGLGANTYLVVIKNSIGCNSIGTVAIVNPPPPAPTLASISGSPIVCPNSISVEYSADIERYNYVWFVSGGTLKAPQNNKVKVDWGKSATNAWVKAIATDPNNCPVDTMRFPVKIQSQLKPSKPRGMDSVCYNARNEVLYQTSFTNGSLYTWYVDDVIYSDGKATPNVSVDWKEVGQYRLWVKEKNAACEGVSDALIVTVFNDQANVSLDFASVDFVNTGRVQVQWTTSLPERVSDSTFLSRRIVGNNVPWEIIATVHKSVHSFLDENVFPDQNAYEYKLEGFNKCNELIQSLPHNTIKLEGQKAEELGLVTLSWNEYNGWPEVEQYEIWRKLDGTADFELFQTAAAGITNYSGEHGADGFIHVFRVKAKKKNADTFSWSNEVELRFENPIEVPNVITPNGDEDNEYFTIPTLPLYPDHQLSIYNHWGETVFQSRDYKNDWRANNLANGVYYYSLYIHQTGKMIKGWLQVVR